jgi:hypothetical protein
LGEAGRRPKRTLTNLYNARPTWLDLAHKRLDEAVFAAYGWKSDLSDEEILEKLLSLNLERSKGLETIHSIKTEKRSHNERPVAGDH